MKTCRCCNTPKDESEFYRHKNMADGLLSECKDCTKERIAKTRTATLSTPEGRIANRVYQRTWMRAERAKGRFKPTTEDVREANQRRKGKDPHKAKACSMVNNAIKLGKMARGCCAVCGNPKTQAHHDDYSKPLDVRWLCTKHHHDHHNKLREEALMK